MHESDRIMLAIFLWYYHNQTFKKAWLDKYIGGFVYCCGINFFDTLFGFFIQIINQNIKSHNYPYDIHRSCTHQVGGVIMAQQPMRLFEKWIYDVGHKFIGFLFLIPLLNRLTSACLLLAKFVSFSPFLNICRFISFSSMSSCWMLWSFLPEF